jgi:hypothetical protein
MTALAWWSIVVFGTTNILTQGKIFAALRARAERYVPVLPHCPLCMGFWVGAFWYLAGLLPWAGLLGALAAGAAGSAVAWTGHVALRRLGAAEL